MRLQSFRRYASEKAGGLFHRWCCSPTLGAAAITVHADLSLLTGFGGEEAYIDKLLAHFRLRMADAANFAARNRVLLLFATNGVGIDVASAAFVRREDDCTSFSFHVSN